MIEYSLLGTFEYWFIDISSQPYYIVMLYIQSMSPPNLTYFWGKGSTWNLFLHLHLYICVTYAPIKVQEPQENLSFFPSKYSIVTYLFWLYPNNYVIQLTMQHLRITLLEANYCFLQYFLLQEPFYFQYKYPRSKFG